MGLFLQTAIIRNRGVVPVEKYLRALGDSGNDFGLLPEECTICSSRGGTVVEFNDGCVGYEDLAEALSKKAGKAVLLCYIYDGDYWGYYLYDGGEEIDRFCPIPDYFEEVTEEEAACCAGNARILAKYFNVSEERLERYLCRWQEDDMEEKAYPEDEFSYEPWQMSDFIAALGFPKLDGDVQESMSNQGDLSESEEDSAESEDASFNLEENFSDLEEDFSNLEGDSLHLEEDFSAKQKASGEISDRKSQEAGESYHFQVNLGGMLDVLSNHLYKSPDVFLRELLQNGIDAITLRQKEQPGWKGGRITIFLERGKRMVFQDNGAGLSEEDIHRFLAIIGQSSKTQLVNGKIPEDYIGRFGIGLLSCFMVSDSIVIHTRPLGGGQAHMWTGLPDGTYTLEPLEDALEGTAVILNAKPGTEHYFQPEKVEELVRYYGLVLPVPVHLVGNPKRLNSLPSEFSNLSRSKLLDFGNWLFEEDFLDAIPIHTSHLSGVAYILSYRTDASVKTGHRIYLKNMLLTERGDTLLPSWAFFLRCFLNTNNLRPTASREDFYEDDELETARKEFEGAIRRHLEELAQYEPERLLEIVRVHAQAIKAMAVWDDELFRLFIDYLPFETSEGSMNGAALKRAGEASWVNDVPKFKQLKPIFMAQGRLLICAGYSFDEELIIKLSQMFSLPVTRLEGDSMELVMEEPSLNERRRAAALLQAANQGLFEFDCKTEVRRFLPADLPALYFMSDEVRFLRHLESAREKSNSVFSGALSSLLGSVEKRPLATLYLNLNNPLIRRLVEIGEGDILKSAARLLYVQALMAGGHPLGSKELKAMNSELLNLFEHGIQ